MKNRRAFLLTLTCGLVALAVIVAPVIADELFGVITKVDVPGKKVTVVTKGGDEVQITTTDDTEWISPKAARKIDLKKLEDNVKKHQEEGKKGVFARVTHENHVASKIEAIAKKKGAPPKKED